MSTEPNQIPPSAPPPPGAAPEADASPPGRSKVPLVLTLATLAVLGMGAALFHHSRGAVNDVTLASQPKPVTVVPAERATYRPTRRYIGTLEPWLAARIGPQLISAYVDTVLVRPGAVVKRGEVLATLDCRNASAMEKAISMQARAVETTQLAIANEASRMSSLLDGGFASANEVELKEAESSSKQAQLAALQAQMAGTSLQVSDCVLRAPFDGEVADRQADPGAFVRPGSTIATLIDRTTVRVTADVPEDDFAAVAPGTPVRLHVLTTGEKRTGKIARRAPAADPATRPIHVEIDLPNANHALPVGTTVEVGLDVGEEHPASELPIAAARVRGKRANLFVVNKDVAHRAAVDVLGEAQGRLYVDPKGLVPGTLVVTLGRGTLREGDRVSAHPDTPPQQEAKAAEEGPTREAAAADPPPRAARAGVTP